MPIDERRDRFDEAIGNVAHRCLGVRTAEQVLVVADPGTRAIAEALREEAMATGADAVLALMDERATDGTEPPAPVAAALLACDAYIAATSRSLSHTTARKRATEKGARGATMPGVTADMLGRVMAVDFELMGVRSRAVASLLSAGETAMLSCPRGSSMTFDLRERTAIADDGDLTTPGAFGNLPCGEAFIAPLSGNGAVVAASLAPLGLSAEPARLTVRDGRIVSAEEGHGPAFLRLLRQHGDPGANLAELGVGTNDRATLTGNVLEDEKIFGSVHVAFGASAAIGGRMWVPIHLDVIVVDATLEIDGTQVLQGGRYVLDGAPQ